MNEVQRLRGGFRTDPLRASVMAIRPFGSTRRARNEMKTTRGKPTSASTARPQPPVTDDSLDRFLRSLASFSKQLSMYGRRPDNNCMKLLAAYRTKKNTPHFSYCATCIRSCGRSTAWHSCVGANTTWPNVMPPNGNLSKARAHGWRRFRNPTSTTPHTKRGEPPRAQSSAPMRPPTTVQGAAHIYFTIGLKCYSYTDLVRMTLGRATIFSNHRFSRR